MFLTCSDFYYQREDSQHFFKHNTTKEKLATKHSFSQRGNDRGSIYGDYGIYGIYGDYGIYGIYGD
jgi:hypothetical protein